MIASSVAWWMLAAVFATVGSHHGLIWLGNTGAREHVWFGLSALAAAAGAAIHALAATGPIASSAPLLLAAPAALAWVVGATWFAVEYAAGDRQRQRIARAVTGLLAVVAVGEMAVHAGAILPGGLPGLLRLLALSAFAGALALVLDAAWRMWTPTLRIRAVVLAIVAVAVALVAIEALRPEPRVHVLPTSALVSFLFVALLLTFELAIALAHGQLSAQRQRHELPQASRLSVVGELTAAIAHEINQPLGAILSNADAGEMLIDGDAPPLEEIRRILADIRRDGLRASAVIRNVRTLVRKRELDLEVVDGNAIATGVRALLETDARRRRIALAVELSPAPAHVLGDRALLEQVLINLVVNAMDAVESLGGDHGGSGRPPVVLAVSRTAHGDVEFSVSDVGPGIPAGRLGQLFDSFHTSKPHGMGLGLAISRSLVEAHGGRIHAANNADAGAVFRVCLPADEGSWPVPEAPAV